MNDKAQPTTGGDDALEQLLRAVPPRARPDVDDAASARTALHGEWQTVVRRRRRRHLVSGFALAASVIAGLFIAVPILQSPAPAAVVASIETGSGSIYVVGQDRAASDRMLADGLRAGHSIMTGDSGGAALRMTSGESLRLDSNVRIEFTSADRLVLLAGRVYVDSGPDGTARSLTIVTPHGDVTHLGTQYITAVDGDELSVMVREGRVSIDGNFHDVDVQPGQRVSLSGRLRPQVSSVSSYGMGWSWATELAPAVDFDGRQVLELLQWFSRETGFELQFESADARRLAEETLKGSVSNSHPAPAEALRIWMMTVDLDWRIDNGVLRISEAVID
ncbi:MAG: FecR family protein [Woeseiaceae bacterium]